MQVSTRELRMTKCNPQHVETSAQNLHGRRNTAFGLFDLFGRHAVSKPSTRLSAGESSSFEKVYERRRRSLTLSVSSSCPWMAWLRFRMTMVPNRRSNDGWSSTLAHDDSLQGVYIKKEFYCWELGASHIDRPEKGKASFHVGP